MKSIKVKIGVLCAVIVSLVNCSLAYAEPTVTGGKDNITVRKTAQWTKLEGKEGYAKITFDVDTTKVSDTVTKVASKGGDADIVIVLDNSGSMGEAFKTAKTVAADFATKMIELDKYNVRVGLVTMGSKGIRAVEFTSDKQKISSTITNLEFDPVMWGTNFQEAIYETQNMLATSKAPNKLVVFQSDGIPEACYKTVNCTNKTGNNIATGKNDAECAIYQTNILNKLYPDVKIVTIGYKTNRSSEDVLYQMASRDANGEKMFYRTEAKATELVTDLSGAFKQIGDTVTNYVYGNSLVDKIPSEYSIVEPDIKVSDSTIKTNIDNKNNTVTFIWDKLEKKVYNISFTIKLSLDKVPSSYLDSQKEIYSNGTTIDVTKDSSASAVFTYGAGQKIELKSPTLEIFKKTEENKEEVVKTEDKDDKKEAIVTNDNKENTTTEVKTEVNEIDNTPKTGDSANLWLMVGGLVVALTLMVGIVIYKKKRV